MRFDPLQGSLWLVTDSTLSQAQVITSLNFKGGVGKTHLCWLIASVCQERGHRCLIVDLDQQANITQSFLPDHCQPTGVERMFDPRSRCQTARFNLQDILRIHRHHSSDRAFRPPRPFPA